MDLWLPEVASRPPGSGGWAPSRVRNDFYFLRARGLLVLAFRCDSDPFSHPQFIDGRLERLNTGEGFSDLFEQEITCSGASSGEP